MEYKVTSMHAPQQDTGLLWDSFGFDWPVDRPILSDRDRRHPPFVGFETPFQFNPALPAQ
jgi:dTDP-4-dehydrorhamnose 3,5-epimerase-like enzyme